MLSGLRQHRGGIGDRFRGRLHQPDDICDRCKQPILIEFLVVVPFLFCHAVKMDDAAIAFPHQRAETDEKDPPFGMRDQSN